MAAERKQSELDSIRSVELARNRCNRDWQARLTRIIPPDDNDTVYPMGKLERPFLRVSAPTGPMPYLDSNGYLLQSEEHLRSRVDSEVVIVAKQKALILPNGAKVVWWDWEMGR